MIFGIFKCYLPPTTENENENSKRTRFSLIKRLFFLWDFKEICFWYYSLIREVCLEYIYDFLFLLKLYKLVISKLGDFYARKHKLMGTWAKLEGLPLFLIELEPRTHDVLFYWYRIADLANSWSKFTLSSLEFDDCAFIRVVRKYDSTSKNSSTKYIETATHSK